MYKPLCDPVDREAHLVPLVLEVRDRLDGENGMNETEENDRMVRFRREFAGNHHYAITSLHRLLGGDI